MAIVVGPNYPIEAMAQVGRQSARALGQEAARQQIFQEQTQLAQLDQGQQTIDQRDRLAEQSIRASRDLQELQGQQAADRIQLEYDRRAQELVQRQAIEEQALGRKFEYDQAESWMTSATQEGQAALRANLMREQHLRQGIGTLYSPEQAATLAQEVLQERSQIYANPSFRQQQLTPEQVFEQTAIRDANGNVIGAIGEDGPEYFVWNNSEAGVKARERAELQRLALEQSMIESQNPTTGAVTRTFDANLYEQIMKASSIAPGESGGMPSGAPAPVVDQVEQAVRALGFDPTVPPTPEQRAAVRQYLQHQGTVQDAPAQPELSPQAAMPTQPPQPEQPPSQTAFVASAIEAGATVENAVEQAVDRLGVSGKVAAQMVRAINEQAQTISQSLRVPISMAAEMAFRSALELFRRTPLRGLP